MSQPLDQVLANWAQVVAAAALCAGAIIAVVTVRTGRRAARQEAVFRYLERHDSESFSQLLTWANGILVLREGEHPLAGIVRYQRLSDYQQDQLWRVLNFWEEISAIYMEGLFEDAIFRETLAPLLIESWLDTHWLVNHLRCPDGTESDTSLWRCWQAVTARMIAAGVRYTPRPDSDPDGAPVTLSASSRQHRELLPPDWM